MRESNRRRSSWFPSIEPEVLSTQSSILRKRLLHRVGVDAGRGNAVGFVVLREETRDQTFSHASLPLQREVHRGGAVGDQWLVIYFHGCIESPVPQKSLLSSGGPEGYCQAARFFSSCA